MQLNPDLYRKRSLIRLALAAGLLCAPSLFSQVGLGLSPMRLDLQFGKNRQHTGSLHLSNTSNEKVRVRSELLDFFIDVDETPQFDRVIAKEADSSCRPWLSLNPMEVELEPQSSTWVRYTFRLPEGIAEGGYHCAAGFTTVPTLRPTGEIGLQTAVRMVAVFYVVAGAPKIEGGFQEIKLEPAPGQTPPAWRAVVVLKNPARMHFRPVGDLAVLDPDGKVLESLPFRSVPVLPQREQRFLFPLKTLRADVPCRLRVRVDIGTQEILEGAATLTPREAAP